MKLPTPPREWDRRTTIVATLGPATSSPERIRQLLEAGGRATALSPRDKPDKATPDRQVVVTPFPGYAWLP